MWVHPPFHRRYRSKNMEQSFTVHAFSYTAGVNVQTRMSPLHVNANILLIKSYINDILLSLVCVRTGPWVLKSTLSWWGRLSTPHIDDLMCSLRWWLTAMISYFKFHFFPHLLIFLQFRAGLLRWRPVGQIWSADHTRLALCQLQYT